jgi:pyruvate-formate lyase-activating enzyme
MNITQIKPQSKEEWPGRMTFSVVLGKVRKYTDDQAMAELRRVIGNVDGVAIVGEDPLEQPHVVIFAKRVKLWKLKVMISTRGMKSGVLKDMINRRVVDFVSVKVGRDVPKETVEILSKGPVEHEFIVDSLETAKRLGKVKRIVVENKLDLAKKIENADAVFVREGGRDIRV